MHLASSDANSRGTRVVGNTVCIIFAADLTLRKHVVEKGQGKAQAEQGYSFGKSGSERGDEKWKREMKKISKQREHVRRQIQCLPLHVPLS